MSSQRAQKRQGISPRTIMIAGFLIVCIGIVAIGFRPGSGATTASGTDANNATLVAEGKQVYAAQCAACHGANLEGQPNWQTPLADGSYPAPPHDASGHTWHHNDRYLFETVRYGGQALAPPGMKNGMPAFPQLSDQQIWAVLSYIKSTWPPEIQAAQSQLPAQ
jgi:mono/diheme cytochrome c family protein